MTPTDRARNPGPTEDRETERRAKKAASDRRWYANPGNRAKQATSIRQWRADPENRAKLTAYMRRWRARPGNSAKKAASARRWLVRKLGLDYDPAGQPGACCKACGATQELNLDHSHTTGTYRGLLCGPCNRALGFLRDDPGRVASLLEYITHR